MSPALTPGGLWCFAVPAAGSRPRPAEWRERVYFPRAPRGANPCREAYMPPLRMDQTPSRPKNGIVRQTGTAGTTGIFPANPAWGKRLRAAYMRPLQCEANDRPTINGRQGKVGGGVKISALRAGPCGPVALRNAPAGAAPPCGAKIYVIRPVNGQPPCSITPRAKFSRGRRPRHHNFSFLFFNF